MQNDFRLNEALQPGDQIFFGTDCYTITDAPIGFGGSALLYPAKTDSSILQCAIKEYFPCSEAHFCRKDGVIRPRDDQDDQARRQMEHYRTLMQDEAENGQTLRNSTSRVIVILKQAQATSVNAGGKLYTDVQDGIFAVLERMDQKGLTFQQLLDDISLPPCDDFPLRTGGLPRLHTAVCLIRETLLALDRVHRHDYLFGDIQGGNVFFSDCDLNNGRIGSGTLLDFGCARKLLADGKTEDLAHQPVCSTAGFLAPELLHHAGPLRLSRQADIFSVGCLLLRCLLPEHRWNALGDCPRYENQALRAGMDRALSCSREAQVLLDKILECAMDPQPSRRYPDAVAMLADIEKLENMTADPKYKLLGLPCQEEGFVCAGDNRLKALLKALSQHSTLYLWGLGGIGKTQLAIQLAHTARPAGGAYFVTFQNSMRETILSMDFSGLHVVHQKNASPEEKAQAEYQARMTILQEQYTGSLLVIDNLDSTEKSLAELQAEPAFQDFLRLDLTRVFTTRYVVDDSSGWQVAPLSERELLSLMKFHYKTLWNRDDALLKLIRAVDGHTLTVVLMARLLEKSHRDLDPKALLHSLQSNQLKDLGRYSISHKQQFGGTARKIFTHLKALFDVSHLSDDCLAVLRCASLLPDDGMYGSLFASCLNARQSKALNELIGRGWLQEQKLEDADDTRITIHPLVRDVCREDLHPAASFCDPFLQDLCTRCRQPSGFVPDSSLARNRQIAACLAQAAKTLPDAPSDYAHTAGLLYEKLGQPSQQLFWCKKALDTELARTSGEPKKLADCYDDMGIACGAMGDPESFLQYCQKALALRRAHLPPAHPYLAVSYNNIGAAFGMLNDPGKRLECYQKALDLLNHLDAPDPGLLARTYSNAGFAHGVLGNFDQEMDCYQTACSLLKKNKSANRMDLAVAYSNLGALYGRRGDQAKQLDYYYEALDIRQKLLPADHLKLAASYLDLGDAYGRMDVPDYHTQLTFYQKALKIQQKVLPVNHPDLLSSYDKLASVCGLMDDSCQQLFYYRKLMDAQENELSPDDPSLADYYHEMSSIYGDLDQPKVQLDYLLKELTLREKLLPELHPDLFSCYYAVGFAYGELLKYEQQLTYYQKALAVRQANLPPDSLDLATFYGTVARVFYILGRYQEALNHYKKQLTIRENVLPLEDPDLAVSYSNIGNTYSQLGDYKTALSYLEKAIVILEKVLSPMHPDLIASYNNIGAVYGKLGNLKISLSYLEKALTIREKVLPSMHPVLAVSYHNIGATYLELGDYKTALSYLEKAIVIQEKVLPPMHPDLATSYNNISKAYMKLRDYKTALPYLKKALTIQKKILPPTHPDLAACYNIIAKTYFELGDCKTTLFYLEKALTIQEKVLPPMHPDLATSYNNISTAYFELGDHKTALSYLEKALTIQEKVLPPMHPFLAVFHYNIGMIYLKLGDCKTALPYLEKALTVERKASQPDSTRIRLLCNRIADTYEALGELEIATKYRNDLPPEP